MARGADEAAWERDSLMTVCLLNMQIEKKSNKLKADALNKYRPPEREQSEEIHIDELELLYKRMLNQ